MKTKERIYHYRIDQEGRLWIENTELTDPTTLKFFMKKMEALPNGKLRVQCMGETNWITAEDAPYVVQALRVESEQIQLIFPGHYQEILDPKTLFVGKENIMYCKVRQGQLRARFNRQSYMDLTHWIEQDASERFYLAWQGKKYWIKGIH